jgi:hypothetical protein
VQGCVPTIDSGLETATAQLGIPTDLIAGECLEFPAFAADLPVVLCPVRPDRGALVQAGFAVAAVDYPRPHDPAAWSTDETTVPPFIVIKATKQN